MTIYEMLMSGGGVALLLMTVVQISPLEIDPWAYLGKSIGRVINAEMITKIDALSDEVKKMKQDSAEEQAITWRTRILRFGDEVAHGEPHSQEHFDQTLQDITRYDQYCDSHPDFVNHKTVLTSKRIKDIYYDCMKNNSFL